MSKNKEDSFSKLEKLVSIIKGRADIKNRVRTILAPDDITTATNLSRGECDFCSLADFVGDPKDGFTDMEPVRDFGMGFARWKLSHDGFGIDAAIRLNSAIAENKLIKATLTKSLDKGESAPSG